MTKQTIDVSDVEKDAAETKQRISLSRVIISLLLLLVSFITSAIALGGIADQAIFTIDDSRKLCLLFTHQRGKNNYYFPYLYASACPGVIGVATTSMVLASILGFITIAVLLQSVGKLNVKFVQSEWVKGTLAIIGIVSALLSLAMAVTANMGINTTCDVMEHVSGHSCDVVFSKGVIKDSGLSLRTLDMIYTAVYGGWICFVSWAFYAVLLTLVWKKILN